MAVAGLGRVLYPIAASGSTAFESYSVRSGVASSAGGISQCGLCTRAHKGNVMRLRSCLAHGNGALPRNSESNGNLPGLNPTMDVDKMKGKLESLFYCDTAVPEEKIEKPAGLPKGLMSIGNKPMCPHCEAKGAVQCATCTGSGLYVDAILESQGIIVKVRCLGCGGAGNHMCPRCGGRGHV